ncbi:MAG: magnesium/cobalt transporter CorA [Chloroflexota bacterium]|nr:magnesium/cobalt transporter CorA [Chloroflexota bacterium]
MTAATAERHAENRLTCLVRNGRNDLEAIAPHELRGLRDRLRRGEELIWVDIDTPAEENIELLRREIGVHPLAIEDLERREQRPKIDAYADHHVIVTYDVRPPADAADRFELAEIHLFVGPSFLVSVHWGPSPALGATLDRFRANTGSIGSGVGALLYAVLDTVGDAYFPVIDAFAEDLDELLDRIIERPSSETLHEVIRTRRRLLELRRVLAPQREVANILLRREIGYLEENADPYFQDLYDHLIRLLESVDLYRDLLAGALDAQISVTSNSLNAVMKRLTAFTVLLMVPTLIAGIYGMNFRVMPELRWAAGYPFALAVMIVSMAVIAIFFWRHDWF